MEATPTPPTPSPPSRLHPAVSPTPEPTTVSSSAAGLPGVSQQLLARLAQRTLQFPTRDECTSLALAPSGHFLYAGFTDGTLRVFDATGRFVRTATPATEPTSRTNPATTNRTDATHITSLGPGPTRSVSSSYSATTTTNRMVCSHHHQTHGAVAGQIHARGVHTSLRMQVAVTPDGQWCFAGVPRGSMELLAVHAGELEQAAASLHGNTTNTTTTTTTRPRNLLDYLSVHRHADAKLRGFGACTKLQRAGRDRYLLLCGKGIKNIHVWAFDPPESPHAKPHVQLIYNCVTNGNSIHLLSFRHVAPDRLLALSQSQQQKLRLWDLSHEEQPEAHLQQRPIRPPFVDVANTEAALGIAGGFCLCGGSDHHFNQISIVSLESLASSQFNHTELALPGVNRSASVGRRQQRGDLKSVEAVAGMAGDGGHAILQLNDRTLVQYTHHGGDSCLPTLRTVHDSDLPDGWNRTMAVGRIGSERLPVAAVAEHNPYTGRGKISLWPLEEITTPSDRTRKPNGAERASTQLEASYAADPMDAIASKIHPFTNTKKSPPLLGSAAPRPKHAKERIPKMRDLTNYSSDSTGSERQSEKVTEGSGTKVVAADRSQTIRMPKPSPLPIPPMTGAASVSPEMRQRPEKAKTHKTLPDGTTIAKDIMESAVLLSKTKWTNTKRPSLSKASEPSSQVASKPRDPIAHAITSKRPSLSKASESSSQVTSKPRQAVRRASDNASLSSSSERSKKKAKRTSEGTLVQRSPVVSEKVISTASKPAKATIPPTLEIPAVTTAVPPKIPKSAEATPQTNAAQIRPQRKEDMQDVIREKCVEQRAKLEQLLLQIHDSSYRARPNDQGKMYSSLEQSHEYQRQMLSAEHRAAYRKAAKTVVRAAIDILNSVQRSPHLQSLESAKELLRVTLGKFRSILDEQLQYYKMQARELADRQTWERQGSDAPCVTVEFPFAHVFDQAMDSLPQLIR